jgi:ribose/xylose/arabinose/galactoside ABC-type transport system permease subunit
MSEEQAARIGAAAATAEEEERQALLSVARARLRNALNALSVSGGLILLCVVFSVASPYFLSGSNIYHILQQVAVLAVLAIGQSFVIYTSGIDLSQGAVLAFASVVGATVMVSEHSLALGVMVALCVGAGAGVVNGLLITRLKLVPFIATLAMLGAASGAALLFTSGQPVYNIPASLYAFGSNGIWVFPFIVLVAAGIAILGQLYLSQTRGGRYVYAIGSNPKGATIAGIRAQRVILGVYALSGLLAGVAAVLQVAYVNSAQPSDNTNLLLESIAAVVIGGGSLFGGEGAIWGTMIGTLLIGVLYNGTELLGISTYVQTILLGLVVVIAVGIDNFRRKERIAA